MNMQTEIREIIKKPDDQIINILGMANLPMIVHVLHKKYHGRVQFIDIGGDCMIRYGKTNVANMSYLATHLHFLRIDKGILTLEGNISLPYVYRKRCRFFAQIGAEELPLALYDAGLDEKTAGRAYEDRRAFRLQYDLNRKKTDAEGKTTISFVTYTDGIRSVCGKLNSYRFMPVADVLEGQYATESDFILQIEGGTMICRRADAERLRRAEEQYQRVVCENMDTDRAEHIVRVRQAYFARREKKTRPLWLFFDRIDKADDNAEALFRYLHEAKRADVERCFVISEDCGETERLKEYGTVIPAMSEEHQISLLLADVILTSQLNGYVENPYGADEEYFRDLSHRAKLIFLQHGVTKDDQTRWLNRFNQNLHAVVCSAEKEKNAFLKLPYFYEDRQLWLTGMPRYDLLADQTENLVLVMPTWRQEHMEQRRDAEREIWSWVPGKSFWESDYRKAYQRILNDENLLRFCKEQGYRISFAPHPIVQPYRNAFDAPREVEQPDYHGSWRELFARGALLVTDYSSVAFDFAYLEKPVLYYQFDRKAFFEKHAYKRGYFNYRRMGFGEIAETEAVICRLIKEYVQNGCQMKRKYRSRVRRFFAQTDRDNCRRILARLDQEGLSGGLQQAAV